MEKVTWDSFNDGDIILTERRDVAIGRRTGQSALAPRTHRWEEFKKDCGKEDVAQTFPHDRTVALEIPVLTLYRRPLV